ncbi:hypothetical protein BCV69DRAFT_131285 [Microstroma glucosiphilum]|uniref:Uncharacterized protein n=1 Tax=Pseudomicrostroma glucosiphilum TaxID=1684307 RepID=A0A316TVS2_9BASI|nr:hypothetical protein BCV69DRAFT_131285 [Pseudomicrostroma glucosiphilum]PWN17652.1 hypothetical protein BCV69DRAFT_131285 [Pseudomicrostroma glucosiphilum]
MQRRPLSDTTTLVSPTFRPYDSTARLQPKIPRLLQPSRSTDKLPSHTMRFSLGSLWRNWRQPHDTEDFRWLPNQPPRNGIIASTGVACGRFANQSSEFLHLVYESSRLALPPPPALSSFEPPPSARYAEVASARPTRLWTSPTDPNSQACSGQFRAACHINFADFCCFNWTPSASTNPFKKGLNKACAALSAGANSIVRFTGLGKLLSLKANARNYCWRCGELFCDAHLQDYATLFLAFEDVLSMTAHLHAMQLPTCGRIDGTYLLFLADGRVLVRQRVCADCHEAVVMARARETAWVAMESERRRERQKMRRWEAEQNRRRVEEFSGRM